MKHFLLFGLLGLIAGGCVKKTVQLPADTQEIDCNCSVASDQLTMVENIVKSGDLILSRYTRTDEVGHSITMNEIQAIFYAKPTDGSTVQIIKVDSVLINSIKLPLIRDANSAPMYYQSAGTAPEQQQWQVVKGDTIPNFIFTTTLKQPSVDQKTIPLTLSKSVPKKIKLLGVKNITSAMAIILDQSGKSNFNISVRIKEGDNEICFPADQLQLLGPGKASLLLIFENTTVKTVEGKNFLVKHRLQEENAFELVS